MIRSKINIELVEEWIFDNLYPIIFFSFFISMFKDTSYLLMLFFLFSVYYAVKLSFAPSSSKFIKIFFSGYIFYNLFSLINYVFNGMPIYCYYWEVSCGILPMFAFYVGIYSKKIDNNFYNKIFYSCVFALVIGLYLYLTMPDWYLSWKMDNIFNLWYHTKESDEHYFLEYGRFTSFFSSPYFSSAVGVLCLSIALSYVFRYGIKAIYFIAIILSLLCLFLTQQRVAVVYGAGIFITYQLYQLFLRERRIYRFFVVEIVVFVIFVVFLSYYSNMLERVDLVLDAALQRMDTLDSAVDERSDQYREIMNEWKNVFFGHGLGSGGHTAVQMGYVGITDGNYHKILYEIGITGIIGFVSLILLTLIRGLKNLQYLSLELMIICYYLVAMIGQNILEFRFIVIPLWYCIGRVWNKPYLNSLKQNIKL